MGIDLTMILIFHTAKNIGIDEKSLSLFKASLLTCCQQTHTALPDIDKFYLLVPVLGKLPPSSLLLFYSVFLRKA